MYPLLDPKLYLLRNVMAYAEGVNLNIPRFYLVVGCQCDGFFSNTFRIRQKFSSDYLCFKRVTTDPNRVISTGPRNIHSHYSRFHPGALVRYLIGNIEFAEERHPSPF